MNVTIRPVTPADEAAWRGLWKKYLEFYETERPKDVYAETWRRILDPAEKMYSCVAETPDGEIIGIANYLFHRGFWDKEDTCYLNDLYVNSDIRGSGAGRALIDAVVSDAKKHNLALVYWLTAEDNQQARCLYDKIATLAPFVVYEV